MYSEADRYSVEWRPKINVCMYSATYVANENAYNFINATYGLLVIHVPIDGYCSNRVTFLHCFLFYPAICLTHTPI